MLNGSGGVQNYAMRVNGVYVGGSVDISVDDSAGRPLLLKDAQALVDATGKAEDVLRRVQARIAITPPGNGGEFALQSGSSICKRFGIAPDRFRIPDDMLGQDENNPMCNPVVIQPPCVAIPRDIVMVLDYSSSMNESWQTTNRINKLREVTSRLIANSGLTPAGNHMALVSFNKTAQIIEPLTSDAVALQNALANSTQLVSGTATGLGIIMGDQVLTTVPPARTGVGQIIVFVSDGDPNPSSEGNRAIQQATIMKARGVEVYSVGILDDGSRGDEVLSSMATDPAHYTLASREDDLDRAISEISTKFNCS
jgi:hypothetical protein